MENNATVGMVCINKLYQFIIGFVLGIGGQQFGNLWFSCSSHWI
jgi:hypothetical protein